MTGIEKGWGSQMTEEAALLAAILTHPEDDTPRLVYADWLDEHEQPERAELIRVQCERAKLPEKDVRFECPRVENVPPGHGMISAFTLLCGGPNCRLLLDTAIHCGGCRWDYLRKRDEDLRSHADDWVPRVNALWDWQRGFVEGVMITAADWLQHADALYWHPSQVALCERCKGDSIRETWRAVYGDCPCSITGSTSRPLPLTAQPLRKVRLTTWPEQEWFRTRPDYLRGLRPGHEALLTAEWPGLEFELPPARAAHDDFARELQMRLRNGG